MPPTIPSIKLPLFSLANKTPDQLFAIAEGGPAGFYPVGVNRFWHGGIHLHGNEPVRAMWDGEVVAYRVSDERLTATIAGVEQVFSHSFVLLCHTYETPKGAKTKFWSLYMHLLPIGEYSDAQSEFSKAPSIFHQKRYTVKSTTDYALAICDLNNSNIVLGYIPQGSAFEASSDPALHGDWHRVSFNGIEGCVDFKKNHRVHLTHPHTNSYTATPTHDNTSASEQGINLRDAAAHGNKVGFAPKGTELSFKDPAAHDKNFLKTAAYRELETGGIFVHASKDSLTASDVVAPIQYDSVVNLNPPLKVKAGELLGYAGPYCNRPAVAHVEIFTDAVGFLDNPSSETWGKIEGQPNAYAWPDFKRIEDPSGYSQDGFVDVSSLVAQLDTNHDGNISIDEIKAALRNDDTAKQLRHLVCRHPTEWSATNLDTKFARLKDPDKPWKLTPEHYQQHLDHIRKLTFWEQVTQKPASSTVWHLHPVAFVKNLKSMMGITKDQLRHILYKTTWPKAISNETHDANIEKFVLAINSTMEKYKINISRLRQCHFLAQIGHESSSLQKVEEYGSNSYFERYDNRSDLGNNGVGQGKLYKGRGLIQLTGCANYTSFASSINSADTTVLDISSEASLNKIASDPNQASEAAGWFWDKHGLNDFADQDDIFGASKVINGIDRLTGEPKGFEDRKKRLAIAKYLLID